MRITNKMLEQKIELLGAPKESYITDENGNRKSNIGTHYLAGGYGGVNVNRIVNEGGGVTCPLGHGNVPKRELYDKLSAYIDGIELGVKLKN